MRPLVLLSLALSAACATEPLPHAMPDEPRPAPPVARRELPGASAIPDAAADAPSADAAAPNLDEELAWARQRWPKDLAGIEHRSPVATLVAWVPADAPLAVWVSTREIACRPGQLARKASEGSELELTVFLKESQAGGVRRRVITTAPVGDRMRISQSTEEQTQNPDGSWTTVGVSATSGLIPHAALSSVTSEAARFDGHWLEVDATCSSEQLPCGDAGTRSCVTCRDVALKVSERRLGARASAAISLSSCSEPCPPANDNPELGRVRRLFDQIEPFRGQAKGNSASGGLYRSLAACRAGAKRK
ncbi:MAG: hypothetical protein HYZ29_16735 [Myxococcales bacterium]|nr:hypothetical protein [Myxococcales bacterium]